MFDQQQGIAVRRPRTLCGATSAKLILLACAILEPMRIVGDCLGMMVPRSNLPILAAFAVTLLSACQSGSEGDGAGDLDSQDPPSAGSILSSYYVENFDAFRDAALDLIENDPRYLLQVADGEWWVDRNGNQVFEEGIDVVLLSDPLKHAGVHYAHASGLTGSGEVIAFSDGGYLLSHEVFDGKVVTDLSDVVDGHGTAVASIAAGASGSMIGVAPGADLILGDFDSYGQLAETARVAAQQGAIALNNSWGFTNMEVTQQTYDSFSAGVESGTYLDALRVRTH
ncbi:S8 family serine peptidase [Salibaculum griseiflavum]|uniref:Peptidase S8/S53 domain-containing protein n=1 Tax=Salibaculum griseiflavum TaxID=1914409 RepID=A0A2V1P259_9RHOB|nr:S8 family serine peptidase [Salibaculum griseiflavum]PWG16406.1 hypothetical protein DFK10_11450 [Salibaculum griseiflavum]